MSSHRSKGVRPFSLDSAKGMFHPDRTAYDKGEQERVDTEREKKVFDTASWSEVYTYPFPSSLFWELRDQEVAWLEVDPDTERSQGASWKTVSLAIASRECPQRLAWDAVEKTGLERFSDEDLSSSLVLPDGRIVSVEDNIASMLRVLQVGTEYEQLYEIHDPHDWFQKVFLGPDGYVYAHVQSPGSDVIADRVLRVDLNGERGEISTEGSFGPGKLFVKDVAVGPDSSVYVLCSLGRVIRMYPDGRVFQATISLEQNDFYHIAVGSSGELYVASEMGLVRYNEEGLSELWLPTMYTANRTLPIECTPDGTILVPVLCDEDFLEDEDMPELLAGHRDGVLRIRPSGEIDLLCVPLLGQEQESDESFDLPLFSRPVVGQNGALYIQRRRGLYRSVEKDAPSDHPVDTSTVGKVRRMF